MVVVDADHPDIETYIDWKVKEEQKVAALVTGSNSTRASQGRAEVRHLQAARCSIPKNPALRRRDKTGAPRHGHGRDDQAGDPVARQGYKEIDFPILDTDWDSEAYLTVSGRTPTIRCR